MNRKIGLTTLAAGAALALAGLIGAGQAPSVRDYVNPLSRDSSVRKYQALTTEVARLEGFLSNEDVPFVDYREIHTNVHDLRDSLDSTLYTLETTDNTLWTYRRVDKQIQGICFVSCIGGLLVAYAGTKMAERENIA